jgi:cytochrome c oxidase subunit 2
MTHRKARDRALLVVAVLAFGLLSTACAQDAPQDVFRVSGRNARKADELWNLVFPIAVAVFVIVEGLLVFAVIKYRHKPGREAAQFHGNTKLEVVLTAVPALILAFISIPTVRTIFDLAEEPTGALTVKVIGHQFWWEYQYPDLGIVTANELHIPTGQPVLLDLEGAQSDRVDATEEVIHSFWVPRLAGSQDIIPGRNASLVLEADEPGTYFGQCKEYCGLGHANMKLRVIAETPADFQAWVSARQQPPDEGLDAQVAEGAQLFQEGADNISQPCASCHSVDATQPAPEVGPNLDGFATRQTFAGAMFDNNEEDLVRWLEDPDQVKPGAKMPDVGLTQEQIDSIIAYLQTLE